MSKIHIGDMDKELAIKILNSLVEAMETYDGITPSPERINAVKMGIESLEQELSSGLEKNSKLESEDCISREAVLKLFATHDGKYLYEAIRDMPTTKESLVVADQKKIYAKGFEDGQRALAEHIELCKEEQEPILDKIRAEIEQTAKDYDKFDDYRRVRGLWIALDIIDKYRQKKKNDKSKRDNVGYLADDVLFGIELEPTVKAIPKADYEARLKADMVAMLTEIQLEIEENSYSENVYGDRYGIDKVISTDGICQIIQQKIDKLKEVEQ